MDIISKAFTILSDVDKREEFDRSGCDPESRSSGMRGFSGNTRGYQFEDEINPEQLFNMFFGGFQPATFMGADGIRYRRQYQRPQHARRAAPADSDASTLVKLLPFFLLFLFSIFSSMFSGTPDPGFSFSKRGQYNDRRTTVKRHVEYFVEPQEFNSVFPNHYNTKFEQFERNVERHYHQTLVQACNQEYQRKRDAIMRAQGWAPFMTDKKKLEEAQNRPLPYCEKAEAFESGTYPQRKN
ncbi:Chaperone protein dnaJ [Basidiobolus ranarum]|uniref:Chaperone protein dnaJ n=1 Tax=Basidiobolus ranarum TaxID=34480 RepID=A0ABR2VRE3_9FUNG